MKPEHHLVVVLSLALASLNAVAALGTSVEACASGCNQASSPMAAGVTVSAGPVESSGISFQQSSASAAPGVIALRARAASSAYYPYVATGRANFEDELQVTGANPLDVQVLVTLNVAGFCEATPGATQGRPNASCLVNVSLYNNAGQGFGLQSTGQLSFVSSARNWLSGFGVFAEDILSANLGEANADLAVSLSFLSLTPGALLSSRSGHDYAAPVPEPGTLALFACGALALRAVTGGRRSRTSTGQ